MNKEKLIKEIENYCKKNIETFHKKRLKKVAEIKLIEVLKRKNPYLYRAKGIESAYEFVKSLVDGFLASHEETIFGNWLEELALFVCKLSFAGHKSSTEGIDLEFERDGIRYLVSIKSGPNWGNSSQIKQMVRNFERISKILPKGIKFEFIEGCCYGRCGVQRKGFYSKYCGKYFWELISGIDTLFTDIIEPIGYKAKEKNEKYLREYEKLINRLSAEFMNDFCWKDGAINWEKLVSFVSLK